MRPKHRKNRKQRRLDILTDRQIEKPPRGFNWAGTTSIHQSMPLIPHPFPTILAPGKFGREVYFQINESDYLIGVNEGARALKACGFDITVDMWVVQDPRVCGKKWFKAFDKAFHGIRVFSNQAAAVTPSYATAAASNTGFYVYELCTPEQSALPWAPPRWRFRTDTTVGGAGLWLAYKCRALGARLLGVDMYGPEYFNDAVHPQKRGIKQWPQAKALDAQIRWLMRNGFIVETMSRTALKYPLSSCRIIGCPDKVYLIATGPNGAKYYDSIPAIDPDTGKPPFIAVVNGAALIDAKFDIPWIPDAWFVSDKDAVHKDYWQPAYQHFKGRRYFCDGILQRVSNCVYDGHFPIDTDSGWFLRSAGTVIGTTLTLLYLSGVKEVHIIGADMSGNKYAGGTENTDPKWKKAHGKVWTARPILDERIKWLKARGMRVCSLSPTKLKEVEMI